MPLVQTSAPSVEPLLLADVKNHLRVDSDVTQDDALLIPLLITAARQHAEMLTGRSLINQGWRLTLDSFPSNMQMGVPFGVSYGLPGNAILLERGPIQAVSAITYTDMGGIQQTMPSTDYVVDSSSGLGRITPVFGKIWPIPLPQINAVRVDFTAGYGAAGTSVPAAILHWMLMRIKAAYEHRSEVENLQRGKLEEMPFFDRLLDPYRIVVM